MWSTAIVAETEKSPYSFFTSRDLFFLTAHWLRSLLGSIYPGDFRDEGVTQGVGDRRQGFCYNARVLWIAERERMYDDD